MAKSHIIISPGRKSDFEVQRALESQRQGKKVTQDEFIDILLSDHQAITKIRSVNRNRENAS